MCSWVGLTIHGCLSPLRLGERNLRLPASLSYDSRANDGVGSGDCAFAVSAADSSSEQVWLRGRGGKAHIRVDTQIVFMITPTS
jgi:hypothetical protein